MLEIRIMKTDESILDLSGDQVEDACNTFQKEFEQTDAGKAILEDGYEYTDYDVDDENLSIVYQKDD